MKKTLAVCYRGTYLALVILRNGSLYDWQRHRLTNRPRREAGRLIANFAADYGIGNVVIDPRLKTRLPENLTPIFLSLKDAKLRLLPTETKHTHRAMIQHLAHHVPSLRPLVTVAPATGSVSLSKRWQTVMLLAAALALAYQVQAAEHGQPERGSNY